MKVNYVAKEDGWWAVAHGKGKPAWHGPFGSKGQAVGYAKLNLQGVEDVDSGKGSDGDTKDSANRSVRGNVQRDSAVE